MTLLRNRSTIRPSDNLVKASCLLACTLCSPARAADATGGKIPLCPSLTIVTAVSQPEGDYESIKTIESVDAAGVRMKYSTERPENDSPGGPPRIEKLTVSRMIRAQDLQRASLYLQEFGKTTPLEVAGTTSLGVSSEVLAALKTRGEADLGMFALPPALPAAAKISTDVNNHPNIFDYYEIYKLQRAEGGAVTIAVTVNGVKTDLPAVHAIGKSDYYGYKAEFYFLDDERNPLALKWRLRIGSVLAGPKAGSDRDTLQVVNLTYHCTQENGLPAAGVGPLERALADNRRVQVYDLYFSFNSADIREESEPTLREIADVLRRHGDWRVHIDGHTDGIAGDAFNLDLSKRRAAAVKDALMARYGIGADRLTTAGHGKSQPLDTNDTEEGRARNRRVELVRE